MAYEKLPEPGKIGDLELKNRVVKPVMSVRSLRPEYEQLRKEYGDRLILVGDSDRPGQIYDALHSGHDKAFVYDN